MKSLFSIISVLAFLAVGSFTSVQAQEEAAEPVELFDTYRNLYHVQINEHGAILKSEEAGETLFIGKDCDVTSPKHGKGMWKYSASGILVQFKERRFVFGRQKLAIKGSEKCKMSL